MRNQFLTKRGLHYHVPRTCGPAFRNIESNLGALKNPGSDSSVVGRARVCAHRLRVCPGYALRYGPQLGGRKLSTEESSSGRFFLGKVQHVGSAAAAW